MAHAWGDVGHLVIGYLAVAELSPRAEREVRQLLGRQSLAHASLWADEVRAERPETAPLHFVNIPWTATAYDARRDCARGRCVVAAIERYRGVLAARGASRGERVEALKFVAHLVGDVHQPLHCVTNNDRGGNCVPVTFFGRAPVLRREPDGGASWTPNLHAVWDTDLVARLRGRTPPAEYARRLAARLRSRRATWQRAGGDPRAWALESHRLADTLAYGKLATPIAPEAPERLKRCRGAGPRQEIGPRYLDAVGPTVEEQLVKAGTRLAMLLNAIWR